MLSNLIISCRKHRDDLSMLIIKLSSLFPSKAIINFLQAYISNSTTGFVSRSNMKYARAAYDFTNKPRFTVVIVIQALLCRSRTIEYICKDQVLSPEYHTMSNCKNTLKERYPPVHQIHFAIRLIRLKTGNDEMFSRYHLYRLQAAE